MQLLNAIALTAAAGIIVPILIHLWNVQTGKTLRVGSIALIKESVSHRARRLKISQWLLLLVRVALILLLALLLAQPVWQPQTQAAQPPGWILIEKAALQTAYQHFGDTIESLREAGYEIHGWQAGFPLLSPEDTISRDASRPALPPLSYWDLLDALSTVLPDSVRVHLFTDQRLAHFQGPQPRVAHLLRWHTYPPSDSSVYRLVKAYPTVDDSLRFIGIESTPTGNQRTQQTLAPDQDGQAFTLTTHAGQPTVHLATYPDTVRLDTAALEVAIYGPASSPGGDYVYAALRAIETYTGQAFRIVRARRWADVVRPPDVLFWLSDDTIPPSAPALVKKTGVLFSYATGATRALSTWLVSRTENTSSPPIALYQRIVADSIPGDRLWSDGFGQVILSRTKDDAQQHYRFFSRFDPAWTSLVWRAEFVQWLARLVIRPPTLPTQEDRRLISTSQMRLPVARPPLARPPMPEEPAYPLSRWVWVASFLLFALERTLSYRQKNAIS